MALQPKTKKVLKTITAFYGIMAVLSMIAILVLDDPERWEELRVKILSGILGPDIMISGAECGLLDLPGEGPRAFELTAKGLAGGPPGSVVKFVTPDASARTKQCADWTDCVRSEGDISSTGWNIRLSGISEKDLPNYSISLTARLEKEDAILAEEQKEISCGQTYAIYASVYEKEGGTGKIFSKEPAIDCSPKCQARALSGDTVTLYAKPSTDSYLVGWFGDCEGTAKTKPCILKMDSDKRPAVEFRSDVEPTVIQSVPKKVAPTPKSSINGSVSMSGACEYVGNYGQNLREYKITLGGEATAPVGGNLRIRTSPTSGTFDDVANCGSWEKSNHCTSNGEATGWNYTYGFYSQRPIAIEPSVSVTDSRYYILDSASVKITCP